MALYTKLLARLNRGFAMDPLRYLVAVGALCGVAGATLAGNHVSQSVSQRPESHPAEGGFEAVYVALKPSASGTIYRSYLVFLASGWVTRDAPCRGLERIDLSKLSPESVGRYRVGGDKIEISWRSGDVVTVQRTPGRIDLYGGNYQPMIIDSRALVLQGRYGRSDGEAAWPTIEFRSDGSFVDEGVLDYIGLPDTERSWRFRNPPTGPGTYRITNGTLSLRYAGGHTETVGFVIEPNDAGTKPTQRLRICDYRFERKR